jgi:hypothetical protein
MHGVRGRAGAALVGVGVVVGLLMIGRFASTCEANCGGGYPFFLEFALGVLIGLIGWWVLRARDSDGS